MSETSHRDTLEQLQKDYHEAMKTPGDIYMDTLCHWIGQLIVLHGGQVEAQTQPAVLSDPAGDTAADQGVAADTSASAPPPQAPAPDKQVPHEGPGVQAPGQTMPTPPQGQPPTHPPTTSTTPAPEPAQEGAENARRQEGHAAAHPAGQARRHEAPGDHGMHAPSAPEPARPHGARPPGTRPSAGKDDPKDKEE